MILPNRVSIVDYFEREIVLNNVKSVPVAPPDNGEWYKGREWFVGEVCSVTPILTGLNIGDLVAFTITEQLPASFGRIARVGSRKATMIEGGEYRIGEPLLRGSIEW